MSAKLLKNHPLPVQIEGLPYISAGLILLLASISIYRWAVAQDPVPMALKYGFLVTGFLTGFIVLFSLWFYRNPNVKTPSDDAQAVYSPASGTVLKIEEVDGKRIGASRAKKISIFMSPLDVHVNRSPVPGVIENVEYVKGKFFKADLDKASEENEHNWLVMKSNFGPRVAFVQIAGFIARRIVCYVEKGESLSFGERYGMIRFGSRMEIVVPLDSEILVQPGQKTDAGVTKLARFRSAQS
jgi:phosphatidylserine decarboxylase